MGKVWDFLTGKNTDIAPLPGTRAPMTGNGYRPINPRKVKLDKAKPKGKHRS
jgi:hypothetical protein